MRTLRTIVATAVVTLAASAVAYAGVNGVGDKSAAAATPMKAIAAHQRVRAALASGQATTTKREQHVVRHQNEVRHAHSARHAEADPDRVLVRTQTREADRASSGDQTCDQTRQQTRDQTCDQNCDQTRQRTQDQTCDQTCPQTRERARDGSGECGGGCGD